MTNLELFAAMATGKTVNLLEAQGYHTYTLRIQGLIREDGSGHNWIMLADDTDFNEPLKFFVRTTDGGGQFTMRYIPKNIKIGY